MVRPSPAHRGRRPPADDTFHCPLLSAAGKWRTITSSVPDSVDVNAANFPSGDTAVSDCVQSACRYARDFPGADGFTIETFGTGPRPANAFRVPRVTGALCDENTSIVSVGHDVACWSVGRRTSCSGGALLSTGCTNRSSASVFAASAVNASLRPSGDQIGECAPPSTVNCIRLPNAKSRIDVYRPATRAAPMVTASFVPSGEKRV